MNSTARQNDKKITQFPGDTEKINVLKSAMPDWAYREIRRRSFAGNRTLKDSPLFNALVAELSAGREDDVPQPHSPVEYASPFQPPFDYSNKSHLDDGV